VAFKVLLADDSVPAQNMGKKILTDAGYDVLTVSNGLEALRKIADTMPDIAILDIFMPGYTGLEICERLRANVATAELPVILTVGKLEPYRPEDGEHVRSNAVIVKPFAAAELTAAVRSLIGTKRAEVVYSAETPPPPHVAAPLREEFPPAAEESLLSAPAVDAPAMPTYEPLSSGVSAANAASPASENPGLGIFAAEPVHAGEEPSGPESLVFNPDAGRTPFSASAVEVPLAKWDSPAETGPSAFTEFDLELEPSSFYTAEPSPVGAATDSLEPEAPVHEIVQGVVENNADGILATPEPAAIGEVPDFASSGELAEPVGAAATGGEAVEVAAPDVVPPEVPLHDPFLDESQGVAQAAAPDLAAPKVDSGWASEDIILEDAEDGNIFSSVPDAPLTPEEEAKRQAFEDLFNSDVPFPLEDYSIPASAPAMVAPPSLTESSTQEPGELELEPEIVSDGREDAVVVPEYHAEAADVFEHAADPIFESELLLEDKTPSSWSSFEIEQPPVAAPPAVLSESNAVQPEVISNSVPQVQTEEPAKVAEIPAAPSPVVAAPAELLPETEASPERSELVAEVAKVGALLEQMQAVRQVDETIGHDRTGAEFRQSEAAPYLHSFGGAAEAESSPEQASEVAQIEAAPATALVETELQEMAAVPTPSEPELVSAPLEVSPKEMAHYRAEALEDETALASAPVDAMNEAERIHKAVEVVFDRFKPLLVAAIVRELIRRD
jgi:CheY-like chemotaxis protein